MANGKIPTMIVLCGKCGIIRKCRGTSSGAIYQIKWVAGAHAKECKKLRGGETVDIYRLYSSAFK